MSKIVTLDWNDFFAGSTDPYVKPLWVKVAAVAHTAMLPGTVLASSGDQTWGNVFSTVLNISDWLCVGIITYSGVTWMFGNRTKAMEFLMCGSIGYIIIRHAIDIRNWLKTI